jgi:3-hydroxyacyl-[acyl-carrier-protein] dehydratase
MRLEHSDIAALLPHRYPMLLLDRVDAVRPGETLHAYKAVTGCEPCYRGIAPDQPADRYAYPASLLIESFGQAAAVLWLLSQQTRAVGLPMFTAAKDCVIRHAVRLEQAVDGAAFAAGTSWVGDDKVAEFGSLMAVIRPAGGITRERSTT